MFEVVRSEDEDEDEEEETGGVIEGGSGVIEAASMRRECSSARIIF